MEEDLRTKGVNAAQRREILAEVKSHLVDRIEEFQAEGSPDPVGQALALGDPLEIASEWSATANLRAASHSFFPMSSLSAAWSMAHKFGRGLCLFLFGFVGYTLSLGALITMVMKMVFPDRVGLWVGDFGLVWGILPILRPVASWLATGLSQSQHGWPSCLPLAFGHQRQSNENALPHI